MGLLASSFPALWQSSRPPVQMILNTWPLPSHYRYEVEPMGFHLTGSKLPILKAPKLNQFRTALARLMLVLCSRRPQTGEPLFYTMRLHRQRASAHYPSLLPILWILSYILWSHVHIYLMAPPLNLLTKLLIYLSLLLPLESKKYSVEKNTVSIIAFSFFSSHTCALSIFLCIPPMSTL